MMRLYYLVICLLGITFLNAQDLKKENKLKTDSPINSKFRIGLSGGVTLNEAKQNLSNLVYSKYSGESGFFANAYAEYRFTGPFVVSTGVSLLQKNFKFERTGSHKGVYTNYKTSYLNFPVMLGVYLVNPYKEIGFKLVVSGGGYLGYWLNLKKEGRYQSLAGLDIDEEKGEGYLPLVTIEEKYDFDKNENNYNRFDYGLQGDIKAIYDFTSSIGVSLGYTYKHGFSNMYKNHINDHPLRYRTSIIYLGILYKL